MTILNLGCPSGLSEEPLKNCGPNCGPAPLLGTLIQLLCVWAPGHWHFKLQVALLGTVPLSIKVSPSLGMTSGGVGPAPPQVSAPTSCLGTGFANDRVPLVYNFTD